MALTRLQDDLLHDFKEQKAMIEQQLKVFDPLGTELSKPAAQRLVSKGALIGAEILCYLLTASSVVFAVFMAKVPPFTILPELRFKPEYTKLGLQVEMFNAAIYGMVGVIAILFYLLGRGMRSIRLKNDILHFAGKNIKTLVSQNLQRRAAIQVLGQRHFFDIPSTDDEGVVFVEKTQVNEVRNPGYEE
jgi:hypothetical protein